MISLEQLRMALNLKAVQRFQTHETLKLDHVDRHSFRATAFYIYFGGTEIVPMLFHDLEESITGDLPSPIKKYLQGLDQFETLRPQFKDEKQEKLSKMCDTLDIVFQLYEQLLNAGILPPALQEIYDIEVDKLLDRAEEVGLKSEVKKLLKELKKPFNRKEIVENLFERLEQKTKSVLKLNKA